MAINKPQEKLDKAVLKNDALVQMFSKRIMKARKEYKEAVEGTIYETQMVSYRNNLFNPLQLRPHKITGLYEIDPDSKHGQALDRLIRAMDDLQTTTGHLTYILNFVESRGEFNFIVFGDGGVSDERKEIVDAFISNNTEKLKYIKRLRLLSEIA